MKKKMLISSIIVVSILIVPTSIAISINDLRFDNIAFVNNLKIKPLLLNNKILYVGKISNYTHIHGYTPSCSFHIDLVLTFGDQTPFFQIIQDRDEWIALPLFFGFINEFFIFGILSQ
jgi:hypothetical protein